MEAKLVQSGLSLPFSLTQVLAHRWPSKWSPYICWQRWQLRRQAVRRAATDVDEEDDDVDEETASMRLDARSRNMARARTDFRTGCLLTSGNMATAAKSKGGGGGGGKLEFLVRTRR